MKGLVKMLSNAALVVGGFLIVLFGTSRVSNQSAPHDATQIGGLDSVAYADVPYSEGAYYAEGGYGGGGGGDGDGGGDGGGGDGK